MKPNCIGIIRKRDGKIKYYWCKLQFWKYKSMKLDGAEDGALSYPAYELRYLDTDYLTMGTDTAGAIEEIAAKINELIENSREKIK